MKRNKTNIWHITKDMYTNILGFVSLQKNETLHKEYKDDKGF